MFESIKSRRRLVMKKLPKLMIFLSATLIFLWGSAVSAFELQYEKEGKAYYKADDGTVIVHEIDKEAVNPQFLYNDEERRAMYFRAPDGRILEAKRQGGNLSNTPDYRWWYGCSPTAAGMMMGYYDYNGYTGLYYQKLVPGGPAELTTYPSGAPAGTYRAQAVIASNAHIADYWTGSGNSGDDPCNGNLTTCHGGGDCLADFMGTSQDLAWLSPACDGAIGVPPQNTDGGTLIWNYDDGRILTAELMGGWTNCYWETSGMYGIGEYVQYAGYNYVTGSLYNRYVYPNPLQPGNTAGFTWADYKAEIDAGRPVIIQLYGHSMFGYGYTDPNTVYIYDTWNPHSASTMTWATNNYGGMPHYAVTCLTPTGGSVTPDDVVPAGFLPAVIFVLGD
jgi:hypothetical protein